MALDRGFGGWLKVFHLPVHPRDVVVKVFILRVECQSPVVKVQGLVEFLLAAIGHAQAVVNMGQFWVHL
jgi:hypothetical protein